MHLDFVLQISFTFSFFVFFFFVVGFFTCAPDSFERVYWGTWDRSILASGFDCWVEKPCYRWETPLVIDGTWTHVLADSKAIAGKALNLIIAPPGYLFVYVLIDWLLTMLWIYKLCRKNFSATFLSQVLLAKIFSKFVYCFCCAFATCLTGLSSMMLIWAAGELTSTTGSRGGGLNHKLLSSLASAPPLSYPASTLNKRKTARHLSPAPVFSNNKIGNRPRRL